MSPSESSQWLTMIISVPLTGFLLYRRFKRTFGRQPVRRRAMIARMVIFTLICGALVVTKPTPEMIGAALGGLVIGLAAAFYGFKKTRFEVTAEGPFYTPDPWVGLAMTSIFVGRMVSRLLVLQQAAAAHPATASPFASVPRSPLTTGAFWLLATYYIASYALILREVKRLGPFVAAPTEAPDGA